MKSKLSPSFRKQFLNLPKEVKLRASRSYRKWRRNPAEAGLFFKRVDDKMPIYSVRIGLDYRALGILKDDTMIWYWIGNYDEYDRLLK